MPQVKWKNDSSGFAKSIKHSHERAFPGLHEVESMRVAVHPSEMELWTAYNARAPSSPKSPTSPASQSGQAQAASNDMNTAHTVSPTLSQAGQSMGSTERPHRPEIGVPGTQSIDIVRARTGHMLKPACSSPNFHYNGRFKGNYFVKEGLFERPEK
mmetsp:Transcript_5735/g.10310  ORF Transcript_5735/g.10310 Transcript_5735/m.10310 type:complete len:156 (-) Transcript_5735:253-720(-)